MKKARTVSLFAALAIGVSVMMPVQAVEYQSLPHTFSIDDVQGDFQGHTFGGAAGIPADTTILCDAPGAPGCPSGVSPITDNKLLPNQSITLYPVDSEFGYQVIDFLGAAQKTRDGDYAEGFVGNITAGFPTSAVIDGVSVNFSPAIIGGVAVSNAATDTYKVKPPMGTWCRGLGGNSVKCETEHYSVMEHILSCHELIPYFFADPVSGMQAVLNAGSAEIPTLSEYDCADAGLDDVALIMTGGMLGAQLIDGTPCEAVNDPPGCQMFPNDKTDTQNNVALTTDYSVQLKDDGKALYGWGTMHKRPNDIRLYASLALPAEWKDPGANYIINSAKLVVRHHITNNPNDQLRPEDLENEAAIGRKPAYEIENMGAVNEVWKSTKSCYEGDGDFIDDEFGVIDPDFIGIGTIFKNTWFAITTSPPTSNVMTNDSDLPYPLSSDLREARTNAWFTTVDRDPFEWSYDPDGDPGNTLQNYVGSWLQNDALGALVSGPRWRLRANKYGQDLPGLEIAIDAGPGQGTDGADCYAPPFEKELIKYAVGEPTITEINLLDWSTETISPLADSRGWVDVTQNGFVEVAGANNGVPYTTNGLPMTNDFDLAVYIKGDRKATAVYDAWLEIDYEVAPQVAVPDVVGLPQATAESVLQSVNLVVGNVTFVSDPVVLLGNVISQDPAAGTTVFEGTAVDLVVSLGPAIVDVPDVVGLPQATAVADIQAAGLVVGTVTQVSDPLVPLGNVISQDPVAGTSVNAGTAVDLVISTGPATVDVPDVVGLPQATAEADIQAAGLVVGAITLVGDPVVPAGNVISQDPLAGTMVSEGTAVDLVVSLGLVSVDVPDVVGLPQAAAEADIQAAGLVVGTVSQANDPVVPVGNVISQAPAAGTTVNSGSAVDLVVSIGPVPVQVSVEWIRVRESIPTNTFEAIIYKIFNNDTTSVTGTATLSGTDGSFFTESFTNLAPGTSDRVVERWTSPSTPQTVDWTLTVTVDGVVVDTLTASTVVQ